MTQAFPLHWPDGWPRTKMPQKSKFNVSFTEARDGLMDEVKRLGGRLPVLSSDLELRGDGLPYAKQRAPADKGVAIYFEYKGKQRVFACDRWDNITDNMRALQKTIEAIRGIERWGASEMMERAFAGFDALPAPDRKKDWREVLGIDPGVHPVTEDIIKDQFRRMTKKRHPDAGGSAEEMAELNAARDRALDAIGAR